MQSGWIFEIAELYLSAEPNAALLSWDGEILHAKSNLGFETPGFRSMTESALKYIAAKAGDVIIANDPYLGGSYLHRYNFLMPLVAASASSPGLVLCIRRDFSPRLNPCDKLDEEGLRIPPTPIFQGGHMVTPIIEAMSHHPLCPEGFGAWLSETVNDLKVYFAKWQSLDKNLKLNFTTAQVKKFIAFSNSYTIDKISEKTPGEGRSEVRLDTGETLKLRLEIHDGLAKADFSGSSPGFKTHLPDGATFGACYEALADFYDFKVFKNSGTFAVLQVIKPLGCFLNAKYPSSTHRGMQSGIAAVRLAMNIALRQIIKLQTVMATENEMRVELAFADSRWLSLWTPKVGCEALSLEKVEAAHPIEFLKMEKNIETAMVSVEFKILKPCQARWHSDFTLHAPRLPAPWKANTVSTIEMMNEKQEWVKLPSQGSTDLAPQSHLRIHLFGHFDKTEKI